MIVSRAPVRISLGGGGTDLPSYYSRFGGFLMAGAINKYVFLMINRRFLPSIRLSYSETEIVDSIQQIRHAIFREGLRLLNINSQIELVSVADVPANCGLGTSSSFTVALLNGLHQYKREYLPLRDLAEEACRLEIEILGYPIGKQDQYAATFGELNAYWFEKDGTVRVEAVKIPHEKMLDLERNILLFYVGNDRSANEILSVQNTKTNQGEAGVIENLHRIKEIGLETKAAFERGDIDAFGELLHHHWQVKRQLSTKISDARIDELYDLGRNNGALGGKIIGAGGGGFLLLYCPGPQSALIEAMAGAGVHPMRFRFDFSGAKVTYEGT